MSKDLSSILEGWEFEPDEVMVRVIEGDNGRKKIQLRVDLGVLQMELDGRPDGTRPESCESWLEYYRQKQQAHDALHLDGTAFCLNAEDCARLWREGVQYYHRYLSCWHLEMYEPCARDTARNLELFAFVRQYAGDQRQKLQFDQWRPYVTMMYARSVATPLIQEQRYEEGLEAIEAGIDAIRDFLDEYRQSHRAHECVELLSLERWREEILQEQERAASAGPGATMRILRRNLEAAVAAEEFEEAARLRDEIRRLSEASQTAKDE